MVSGKGGAMKRDLERRIFILEQRLVRYARRLEERDLTEKEIKRGIEDMRRLEIRKVSLELELQQKPTEGVLRQNPIHKITLIHPSDAGTVICSC
jgi:hypothetical protein